MIQIIHESSRESLFIYQFLESIKIDEQIIGVSGEQSAGVVESNKIFESDLAVSVGEKFIDELSLEPVGEHELGNSSNDGSFGEGLVDRDFKLSEVVVNGGNFWKLKDINTHLVSIIVANGQGYSSII